MAAIPTRTLGRTGLEVTVLGFGAMELRSKVDEPGPPMSPELAGQVLKTVLDSGINYIDTSIDYGESERFIGQFLAHRRDEFFLASKCGCTLGDGTVPPGGPGWPHTFDRANIVAGVEQSLRKMNVDYLDLVQIHNNPSKSVLEAEHTVETLLELQKAGKVRFIGMSSFLPNLGQHLDMGVFDVFQIPYSAVQRENEIAITDVAHRGAGVVVRGGVANGPPSERRRSNNLAKWQIFADAKLDDLMDGMSEMEFLLRFTITNPAVTTTIIGTANPDHVIENAASASRGVLPAEIYEEAKSRLAEAGAASR